MRIDSRCHLHRGLGHTKLVVVSCFWVMLCSCDMCAATDLYTSETPLSRQKFSDLFFGGQNVLTSQLLKQRGLNWVVLYWSGPFKCRFIRACASFGLFSFHVALNVL